MGSENHARIEGVLSELLKSRLPADQARLSEAIGKGRGLQAWIKDPSLPEELRNHLRASRAELGIEILDLLCDWQAIGGRVDLGVSDLSGDEAVSAVEPVESEVSEDAAPSDATADPVPVIAPPPTKAASEQDRPVAAKPAPAPIPSNAESLRALVRDLAAQRTPSEEIAFFRDLARDAARFDRVFPTGARIDALAFLVARARHLRGEGSVREELLAPVLSAVATYARHANVGAVHGPSRSHGPRGASWASDAAILLARLAEEAGVDVAPPNPEKLLGRLGALVSSGGGDAEILELALRCLDAGVGRRDPRLTRILRPVLHALDGKRFKDVRAAIRDAIAEESDAEDAVPEAAIPDAWPFRQVTSGKRAVMVGGDSRETNRRRIQETFGFASLEWARTEFKKRELQALRGRVERGGVDMVILLTAFVGHSADDIVQPACQARGIPFVPVHTGYGIVGIRAAIERHGSR